MRPPSLDITDEQEANLRKLAAYLMTEVSDKTFSMESYMSGGNDDLPRPLSPAECGTVACAAGHGPSAGIKPRSFEGWARYVDRVFCEDGSPEWYWCFSGSWANVDNTPSGAAKRILQALEFGVPEDSELMAYGKVPLCYAKWKPEGVTA